MKKFAAIFPGQGAQFVGMLSSLSAKYKIIEETFSYASEVLGYDLWSLTQKGPIEKLNKTHYTQPAVLTASVAIYNLWLQEKNIKPNIVVGYSLGEYTAMVCSNIISFHDAIKLVKFRGQLMNKITSYMYDNHLDGYYMYSIIGLKKK
ncbi:acyltransferase domain-containing protein [Enterobacteriaceae endosymbiont of Donacia tomentosa]|uniref:ACP S-malonyltransferase n=1 Tax=Enterobacteriaceae endosymbiont of Donacia tomentosa TaxID=2675787 RepID=UPI00144915D2|nr:acyltransferase domain-containing protein [Enterobacteriaceae endosymbiont of Donacia tomentosa]QJC31536.1 acyltransferase domain-containing protein [Enterobacteriaceae endosymbiont of Donacia tomentosa]